MPALFDILTSKTSESDFEYNSTHTLQQSIKDHLERLLNTRRGSLTHMPDYGLPDVVNIYNELPDSIQPLLTAIKQSIEKYEPRLHHVFVSHYPEATKKCIIKLRIQAVLVSGERIHYDTFFMKDGIAEVQT